MAEPGFGRGLRDGIPIALGYFTISIAFGLYCARGGVGPWSAATMALTNLSSSGQFGGLSVILAGGALVQLAVTVALVNLRYLLMSFSLSQRLAPGTGVLRRLVMAYGVTDEIYAVAMSRPQVGFRYFTGLMSLPVIGWTGGTLTGTLVGSALPASLHSAMGVLLYAMFVAIVVPVAKGSRAVRVVVLVAGVVSSLLALVPGVRELEIGWRIIIATVVAAAFGAALFPVPGIGAEQASPREATPEPDREPTPDPDREPAPGEGAA
ncbi:Predicted branched-chain amino acid permease (azaleucine resistance) [Raineyella antarctica]|uniref:Predicted branched-chain amino acid permease (Azaleucine resistance) n=1 Tax=Raineyella antarctica TaxID=1577474 RepID=A0A1G6GFJ5_9ACTN|nr:AzlC family ABC transporter permease [Raineyella antarctica]SDB80771.1 Predicted branched-chain amino acid permease (azaleucine resistance) [Raineyella antarctica]